MHTLVKIKELNSSSKLIKVGDPFVGEINEKTLKIGESLYVSGPTRWRVTSTILEITNHPINKGVQVIRTLNSIYHLIPFKSSKE